MENPPHNKGDTKHFFTCGGTYLRIFLTASARFSTASAKAVDFFISFCYNADNESESEELP